MKTKHHVSVVIERTNGYARELIRGIADFASGHPEIDFQLFEPESFIPDEKNPSDGYICRITSRTMAERLMRLGKPVVDLLCLYRNDKFAAVRPDVKAIVGAAVDHFTERRFTHFAFCGFSSLHYSNLRRDAFVEALAACGSFASVYQDRSKNRRTGSVQLQINGSIDTPPDRQELGEWLTRLPKPIALLCCDDFRAHQVMTLCRALDIRVPTDMAVMGIDDDPVICTFTSPRLSSIDPNAIGIGRTAAEEITSLMKGATFREVTYVSPRGISIRESTETYPLKPDWLAHAMVYIGQNATSGISASDVFSELQLSHTTVQRAFRDILHSTVQKAINAVRIEEARKLLRETDLPVIEISRKAGFSNICYFTHTFTTTEGISPRGYRERHMRPKA